MVEVSTEVENDPDDLDEVKAIRHCLEYLYRETLRLCLVDAADCIAEAIETIEESEAQASAVQVKMLDS